MEVTHRLVHGRSKNVAVVAEGKGKGDLQVHSGMPIYVPREGYKASPPYNHGGRPAFTSPAAATAIRSTFDVSGSNSATLPSRVCKQGENFKSGVAVAAMGMQDSEVGWGDDVPSDRRVFVPDDDEEHLFPPAFTAPPAYPCLDQKRAGHIGD